MRNILIQIEYDGTHYCGWQIQKNLPTIQGEITRALKKLTGTETTVHGSGRTDAGVHARGQAASFLLNTPIPVERIPLAMNALLPSDISIKRAYEVNEDFHARFSAIGKQYSYQIFRGVHRSALLSNYSYHVSSPLNMEKLEEGAHYLEGTHNFAGFMASGSTVQNTVRTVYGVKIEEKGESLWLTFEGNGFLYNMVRIMVGTLIEIGTEKRNSQSILKAFETLNRVDAGKTAPPQGLFLNEVFYPLTR